jgi:hypothetical protein
MNTLSLALAGWLVLVASSASALTNLVVNGDFEAGNTGFSSDYLFAFPNNGEGQYFVGTNAQAWNGALVANPDHTEGDGGLMFLGNGSSAAVPVWFSSEAIPVSSDTDYFFEAWVMNLCCRPGTLGNGVDPVGPSVLSFYANDELLGTRTSSELGVWEPLSTIWSSGSATSVILKLVNSNTAFQGNDFAVDDIFLGTETSVPEPGTAILILAGLGGLAARRGRSRRAAA